MRHFEKMSRYQRVMMRFAGGGAADPGNPPPADPPADPPTPPADPKPADPKPADPPAKTYSEDDLAAAKAKAVEEYKQHLEEAKDYDKMTDAEKVAYLEAQRVDDKLTQYATGKLAANEMPQELLPYIKGKDEADTDTRIKAVKDIIDKAAQAGVEKRFKDNGYLPKSSAAGDPAKEPAKRQRGVTVN